jgi:hypothetical protein
LPVVRRHTTAARRVGEPGRVPEAGLLPPCVGPGVV